MVDWFIVIAPHCISESDELSFIGSEILIAVLGNIEQQRNAISAKCVESPAAIFNA